MTVRHRQQNRHLEIVLCGELDHHAAREAVRRVAAAVDAGLPQTCCLNMREVSFMDSSGIAVVLDAYRRLKELGGTLILSQVPAQASRVFSAAQLEKIIEIQA